SGALTCQTDRQRRSFFGGKVIQFDATPDVKRSHARIANQITWCGYAQQAEGQATEFRIFGAAGVTLPDGREEFVRRGGQTTDYIQFIHKNDDWTGALWQDHIGNSSEETLHRTDARIRLPEILQIIFQAQLPTQAQHQSV